MICYLLKSSKKLQSYEYLTTYFTASCLFTFVREGTMYVGFNSVTLFAVPYTRFLNCAKDVSKVTAQPTILEFTLKSLSLFPLHKLQCIKNSVARIVSQSLADT